MHIYNITVFFALAVMFLFSSCEKELDFEYHDIYPQLVIDASLTEKGISVSLTNTTPMDEPMDTVRLRDASVVLTDLTADCSTVLHTDSRGYYVSDTRGITDHDYRLDVVRAGKHYSATGKMLKASEVTGLKFIWIKMPYDDVAALQISFTEAQEGIETYWVRIFRNGKPYSWVVINHALPAEGIINLTVMTTRRDTEEEEDKNVIHDGDVISVSVTPVSLRVYDYLSALSADSNGPSLYDGDFCLGCFITAPAAAARIVFRPDEIETSKTRSPKNS